MTSSTFHFATDVAVTFQADWEGWVFALNIAVAVASVVWIAATPYLWALVDDLTDRRSEWVRTPAFVLTGTLTLASLICAYALPGAIMRHLPHHEQVWLVVAGAVAALGALGWWAWREDWRSWMFWVPAAVIAAGTLIGAAIDALNRAAASIPTSVGGLFGLIVLGAIVVVLWMRRG